MNFSLGAPEIALLLLLVSYIFPLLDIWRGSTKDSFEKIFWSVIVLLFPFVGAIIYLSVGRKEKFIYEVIRKFKSAS